MSVRSRNPRSGLAHLARPALAFVSALALAAIPACGADSGGSSTSAPGEKGPCSSECSGATPVCDAEAGECVECLPEDDACPAGQYCAGITCELGCTSEVDCAAPLLCDTTSHVCVACTADTQCPEGMICTLAGQCAVGCSEAQPCEGALECCTDSCSDTQTDPSHCGSCEHACSSPAHADAACVMGECAIGTCDDGFADCDLDSGDGCEHDLATGGCACVPGETKACYTGPDGTEGVGSCAGGQQTCDPSGTSWGACAGQTTPLFDECGDGLDEDCDGVADNPPDGDGDGWTKCEGDCCDSDADGCGNPELVNPGAFEAPDNLVDDDCNGVVDDALAACDAGLASNASDPLVYAKAIDLCATTVESPPSQAEKKWGVISGKFSLASGSGTPAASSRSIRGGFGSGVLPLLGSSLAVLSTGSAAAQAAPNNASPAYVAFQGGQDMGKSSTVPADWLAANGSTFPNAPGCPAPQGGTTAHDPIQLKLRVRVPTNARSFNVSTFFYSSEYPEWVCSAFNDFFLTLLDSAFVPGAGQSANPADKNLAFYDPPPAGGAVYPVGVNLAFGNTGLFTQCKNGATGCGGGAVAGNTNTCQSTAQLTGTGFQITNPAPQFLGDPGYCGTNNLLGGGTGWLTTSGNVVPGETMEIRFVIWDTGDQWYDSLALLDRFEWSVDASTPGTHQ